MNKISNTKKLELIEKEMKNILDLNCVVLDGVSYISVIIETSNLEETIITMFEYIFKLLRDLNSEQIDKLMKNSVDLFLINNKEKEFSNNLVRKFINKYSDFETLTIKEIDKFLLQSVKKSNYISQNFGIGKIIWNMILILETAKRQF